MSIVDRINSIISYMENPSLDYLAKDEDFIMTYGNLMRAAKVLGKDRIHAREISIALRLLNNKLVIRTAKKINLGSTLTGIISDLLNTHKAKSRRCPRKCTA